MSGAGDGGKSPDPQDAAGQGGGAPRQWRSDEAADETSVPRPMAPPRNFRMEDFYGEEGDDWKAGRQREEPDDTYRYLEEHDSPDDWGDTDLFNPEWIAKIAERSREHWETVIEMDGLALTLLRLLARDLRQMASRRRDRLRETYKRWRWRCELMRRRK